MVCTYTRTKRSEHLKPQTGRATENELDGAICDRATDEFRGPSDRACRGFFFNYFFIILKEINLNYSSFKCGVRFETPYIGVCARQFSRTRRFRVRVSGKYGGGSEKTAV